MRKVNYGNLDVTLALSWGTELFSITSSCVSVTKINTKEYLAYCITPNFT